MDIVNYLFDIYPSGQFAMQGIALILSSAVLLIGVLIAIIARTPLVSKNMDKLLRPTSWHLFWFAIVGYLITVIRLNQIAYLGMRILFVALAACLIWYVIARILFIHKELPKLNALKNKKYIAKKEDKYLAKPKHKKKKITKKKK